MIWNISSMIVFTSILVPYIQNGSGYFSTDEWRDSEILKYLSENQLDGKIFSNYPAQIYYYCDIDEVKFTPWRSIQGSSRHVDGLREFNESLGQKEHGYIAWLRIKPDVREWIYDLEELLLIYNLTFYYQLMDGIIYEVRIDSYVSFHSNQGIPEPSIFP